jgi:hypothetical protein
MARRRFDSYNAEAVIPRKAAPKVVLRSTGRAGILVKERGRKEGKRPRSGGCWGEEEGRGRGPTGTAFCFGAAFAQFAVVSTRREKE